MGAKRTRKMAAAERETNKKKTHVGKGTKRFLSSWGTLKKRDGVG